MFQSCVIFVLESLEVKSRQKRKTTLGKRDHWTILKSKLLLTIS